MHGVKKFTWVDVTYGAKTITVKINDKGPWAVDHQGHTLWPIRPRPGYVIDLTKGAFHKLTAQWTGLIRVTVKLHSGGQPTNPSSDSNNLGGQTGDDDAGASDTAGAAPPPGIDPAAAGFLGGLPDGFAPGPAVPG